MLIVTSFIFIALAGCARAVHTIRKDRPMSNIFYIWAGYNEWLWRRYEGANDEFSPSSIFTADFWHVFVFVQTYCWVAAVLSASLWPGPWWLYLLAPGVEGWSFTYFYHYVFPLKKAGHFLHFLKRVLTYRDDHK